MSIVIARCLSAVEILADFISELVHAGTTANGVSFDVFMQEEGQTATRRVGSFVALVGEIFSPLPSPNSDSSGSNFGKHSSSFNSPSGGSMTSVGSAK